MSKLSISFEYETFSTTALNSNSMTNFRDPINGGTELDILDFLRGILV